MIAAHREHRPALIRQPREEPVEHLHGLRGGDGLIVDVPGDEDGVRLFRLCYL